ncbi:MAG: membrane protein insertase YidC [Elusimicrobiota bacterium]
MNNRVILAVAISVMILIIFQKMEQKNNPQPVHNIEENKNVDKKETPAAWTEDETKKEEIQNYAYIKRSTETITNGNLDIAINSIGSGISSIKVKDKKEGTVELIRKNTNQITLLSEITGKEEWELKKISENELISKIAQNGLEIERRFKLGPENILEVENRITNKSPEHREIKIKQEWYEGLGTTEDINKENYIDNRSFAKIDGKVRSRIGKGKYEGEIEWAGVVNRYFIVILSNKENNFTELYIEGAKKKSRGCAAAGGEGDKYPALIMESNVGIGTEEEYQFSQKIYMGLKEYAKLKNMGAGYEKILSFGIFSYLSRIFLNILILFKSFTGNYGISIILLTMVLQVFIFPLTAKSYKSMNAMKEIQPKITNIRTKYKEDPQRMNQEMMALYKRNKVNPFSGCLPLLLQMPIFISLFTMLRGATELRYAHFLWINDLSKADILFSTIPALKSIPVIGGGGPLPFLMGGAMFLQQKFTGGTDGPQKSLVYMMPIMFTFMFMKFPSGLVLYWLSNSILTFFVQYAISKKNA